MSCFSDVRDFTATSETMESPKVVMLLNEYLAQMIDVSSRTRRRARQVRRRRGSLVYFGAPLDQPEHAKKAVACALDMLDALERLNQDRNAPANPRSALAYGVHTGASSWGTSAPTAARVHGDRRRSEPRPRASRG